MVDQDKVKDVFRNAEGTHLSLADVATCLNCTSQDINRLVMALYVKKDLEREPRNGIMFYTITEQGLEREKKTSTGCFNCMYNIHERCQVSETPDAFDWCPRFVNGKINETLTGEKWQREEERQNSLKPF